MRMPVGRKGKAKAAAIAEVLEDEEKELSCTEEADSPHGRSVLVSFPDLGPHGRSSMWTALMVGLVCVQPSDIVYRGGRQPSW